MSKRWMRVSKKWMRGYVEGWGERSERKRSEARSESAPVDPDSQCHEHGCARHRCDREEHGR